MDRRYATTTDVPDSLAVRLPGPCSVCFLPALSAFSRQQGDGAPSSLSRGEGPWLCHAFDGTSKEDEIDDNHDSNVVRFARAYRGTRVYLPGVGTRFGAAGAVLGGWIGLGLHDRVREAMRAADRNFKNGDRVVDIVGFSRGAAAAVHFANDLWEKIGGKKGNEPAVRFLGLYDTVASTGILPGPFDFNLDLEVPPNVRRCCHAMALDEGRASFHLHRMKARKDGTLASDVIQEVWFRGCHSDIGGGEKHEKLANITFCWMMRQAAAVGVAFDAGEVAAAVAARNRMADIKRARFDEGLKKRKPRQDDFVHRSVVARDSSGGPWHVNPPDGCHVIDDLGSACGPFPFAGEWPVVPEPDWIPALVPARTLSVGGAPVVFDVVAEAEWNESPQNPARRRRDLPLRHRRRAARLGRRQGDADQRSRRLRSRRARAVQAPGPLPRCGVVRPHRRRRPHRTVPDQDGLRLPAEADWRVRLLRQRRVVQVPRTTRAG